MEWEPNYYTLKNYLPKANFLVIKWWHPAYNHLIIFHFKRKSELLRINKIYDNYGKLIMKPWVKYIPYPKDLWQLIKNAYCEEREHDGCSYFIYDPVSTLGAFNTQMGIILKSRNTTRRKLTADRTFHDTCHLIEQEMGTTDIKQWIEINV